ncbi:DUF86 domain-containing protein [bacterium]|nr:DUF86 domain-containing protein [bacterium]
MKKDVKILLEHILECIGLIEEYIKDKTEKDFFASVQLQDSIIRRIEIIGEAVKHIPDETKEKYPQIQWKRIASMRDVLVHEYFGIDLVLTWKVAKQDIPELKKRILEVLSKM